MTQVRGNADIERALTEARAEQQRQNELIRQLENRVMFAEDSAREARAALDARNTARPLSRTVRISGSGPDPEEPANTTTASAQSSSNTAAAQTTSAVRAANTQARTVAREPSAPSDNEPMPVIRLDGRARTPSVIVPANTAIPVVNERLPVVPLPNDPGPFAQSDGRLPANANVVRASVTLADVLPPIGTPAPIAQPNVGMALPSLTSTAAPSRSSVLDPEAVPAYERALADARTGRCAQAVPAFATFLQRWPDHPHADNAMYWRAECYSAAGNPTQAIRELQGLMSRYPTGNKVPDALYKLAQLHRRQGDLRSAQRYEARLLQEHPSSDAAAHLHGSLH